MSRFAKKLSTLIGYAVGAIYMALCVTVFLCQVTNWKEHGTTWHAPFFAVMFIFAALAGACIFRRFTAKVEAITTKHFWVLGLVCTALCFAVKLGWVLLYRIEPVADYYTFSTLAGELAGSWHISPGGYLQTYVSVFPHIFGYSSFLSVFYRFFGAHHMTAAVVNVFLSCVSAVCLIYLGTQLHSRLCGLAAGLVWTVLPSQTVYNIFVLSEPYYTCLILLAGCTAHALGGCRSAVSRLGIAALLGVLLALIQSARPIAVIGLIMLAVWQFFLYPPHSRHSFTARLAVLATAVLVFIVGNFVNDMVFESRVGYNPAQTAGYSLAVGFNTEADGAWNMEDSLQLSDYMELEPFDAEQVQQQMSVIASERIASLIGQPLELAALMFKKCRTFLADDLSCVVYAWDIFTHPIALSGLCTGFWLAIWALSFFAPIKALASHDRKSWLLPCLFIIGLTLAQLLVEVAGRYHYSLTAPLALLTAFTLCREKRPRKTT